MPPLTLTKMNLKKSPMSFGALHALSVFSVSRDTEEMVLSPSYTSE